jgi:hypothetical protein
MTFDSNTLSTARERGYSDDEIYSKLVKSDPIFATAKERGYSLEEVASKFDSIKKGGEQYAQQNQQEANKDRNAEREADQQVQPSAQTGPQSGEESRDGNRQVGDGEVNPSQPSAQEQDVPVTSYEGQAQDTQGTQGQKEGQAVPTEGVARDKAQVRGGGVPPPAPNAVDKAAEVLGSGYRGLSSFAGEANRYLWDLAKAVNPIVVAAKDAEYVLGPNAFSENVKKNMVEKGDQYFADQVKRSQLTVDEAKSPVNQFAFGAGHMIGDLVAAAATGGESAEVGALKAASDIPIWKAIAEKSIHGIKAFAPASAISANETIDKAKAEGQSDTEALTEGMKTLFETEAGAALPMNVSSGLKTVLQRGASRVLQSMPLAVAQSELSTMAGNLTGMITGEEHRNTISENIITGNFGDAEKQLAQTLPMGLLGVLGERTKPIKDAGLPATAAVVEREVITDFAKDSNAVVENIYKQAEEAIAAGNRAAASSILSAAKEAENDPKNKTTPAEQSSRQKRWEYLDSQIENLKEPAAQVAQPKPTDATQTREVKESVSGEYPQGDQGGEAPKTGYSHSLQPATQGQKEITGTRIASAAWRDPKTGIVHEGESHEEAMRNGGASPVTDPTQRDSGPLREQFGYTTDKGEFISREDAEVLARKSGQFLGKKTDREAMHSHEVAQDKTKDQHESFTPEKFGPGAAAGAELYGQDLQFGAQIHQGKKAITFEKWRELFEPRMYEGKYDESQLRDIYDRSKQVADIAKKGVPIPEAVKQLGKEAIVPKSKSSIKNEDINRQRASMGLSRLHDVAKDAWKAVWDRAMYKIDNEPQYQSLLISRLKDNPNTALDSEDQAILHHHIINVKHEYDCLVDQINKTDDPSAIAELKKRLQEKENEFLDLTTISQLTGRASAQSLNMRKAIIAEDYSVLGMKRRANAAIAGREEAKGGGKLTEEENKKIEEQAKRIGDLEKELEERKKENKETLQERDLEDFTNEAKKEVEPVDPAIKQLIDIFQSKLQKKADDAWARIEARRKEGRLFAQVVPGLDPNLPDYIIIGTNYIVKQGSNFAKYSAFMLDKLGESVRPYIQQIWDEREKNIAAEAKDSMKKATPKQKAKAAKVQKEIKKKVSEMTPEEKIERYRNAIRENKNDNKDVGILIRKIAKAVYAKEFYADNPLESNQLVDQTHSIVSSIMGDGWTEANTRDAISGYGEFKQLSKEQVDVGFREIKGELRELGKLDDISAKIYPQKSGTEMAKKGVKERILIKANKALLKKLGIVNDDPETQLAGAMDAIKNRLKNHIEELNERIKTGERAPKRVPMAYDAEATALKQERDLLQQQFDTMYGKVQKTMDEKIAALEVANSRLIDAKKKKISEEQDRLAQGKKLDKKSKELLTSPTIERQKAELDVLNEKLKSIRDSDIARKDDIKRAQLERELAKREDLLMKHLTGTVPPKVGPKKVEYSDKTKALMAQVDEVQKQIQSTESYQLNKQKALLQSYRARLTARKAEYERRIAEQDFASKTKASRVLDPETQKLTDEVNKAKGEFDADLKLFKWQNRSNWEKAGDLLVGWKRAAVLSYISTIGKLGTASAEIALFKFPEYFAGKAIEQLPGFRKIAKLAPSEGGGKISDDVANFTKGYWKGLKEFKKLAIDQGDSRLTLLHRAQTGETESRIPKGVLGVPGKIHEAIKNPTKQAIYEMSYARHLNWMEKNIPNFDIHDEAIQEKASIEAFKDANRAIFMEDNSLVKLYKSYVSQAKRSKNKGIKFGGYAADELVPIVKIPINIVKQVFEYQLGAGIGTVRMVNALRKGIENLPPEEANSIMRQMKRGSVGLTMMAIGFFLPDQVGGFYRKGAEPAEDEVGFDEIKLGDFKVPKWAMHHPALIALQIGATVRHLVDDGMDEVETGADKAKLYVKSLGAAQLGLIKEVPLVPLTRQFEEALDPDRSGGIAGGIIKSNIPGFIQEAAKWMDVDEFGEPIKRSPQGFFETVNEGLPWMRGTVTPK